MDNKIHIKATANQNVKVGAMWYEKGEGIDCYLSNKDLNVFKDAFSKYEIVSDNTPPPVDIPTTEYAVKSAEIPIEEEEVKNDGIQEHKSNEIKRSRKSTKKIVE